MKKIIRQKFNQLVEELSRPEISIILGPRQAGKTYLLKELQKTAIKQKLKTVYYNLEIPSDIIQFNKSDKDLFEMVAENHDVVFIDEFHYLKNASKLFKAIYDSKAKVKIVVSGSSSIERHKHLLESLAGRRLVTQIGPLTFKEFMQNYKKTEMNIAFEEYIKYGGLPGLIHEDTEEMKIRILNEIWETYIQKDIKSLIKEENIRAFNVLLYLLAEQQGRMISVNNLAREVGLTARTIEKHLSILTATYVIYPLHSYSKNIGNELKKSRKLYFYDQGIRNAILKDFSYEKRADIGVLHETFILHLLKSEIKPNMELYFWRNKSGAEIDFVKIINRKPSIYEVKTNISKAVIPNAFVTFVRHYPETTEATVISKNEYKSQLIQDISVKFLSFF